MTNLTDITNFSDAALDVYLAAASGQEVVVIEHLSKKDQRAVFAALGVDVPPSYFASVAPDPGPAGDYEGAILDRQDARFED